MRRSAIILFAFPVLGVGGPKGTLLFSEGDCAVWARSGRSYALCGLLSLKFMAAPPAR